MKLISGVLLLSCLLLSGCNSQRNLAYLNARNGKQLVVNAPLNARQLDNTYVLSNVGKISAPDLTPPVS